MQIVKKIIFALPFLFSFFLFCQQLDSFLQNPGSIISFSIEGLTQQGLLLAFLLISSFFFIIFATLAFNWFIVLPVLALASFFPFLLTTAPLNFTLISGFLLFFTFTYFLLERKLNSYLTFQSTALVIPAIKRTTTLIIIVSSFAFYLGANMEIANHGFKLPPSLIDTVVQFAMNQQGGNVNNLDVEVNTNGSPVLTPQQAALVKQNPALMQQFGITAADVDRALQQSGSSTKTQPQPSTSISNTVRSTIDQQVSQIIKPYIQYIPIVYTAIFFGNLLLLAWIFSLFLVPLVALLFFILEKIGFTKYVTEMREVKKLVV